jgi:hypothetical protein
LTKGGNHIFYAKLSDTPAGVARQYSGVEKHPSRFPTIIPGSSGSGGQALMHPVILVDAQPFWVCMAAAFKVRQIGGYSVKNGSTLP